VRIVADLQDNRIAERVIAQHTEAAIAALENDRTLGGRAEIVTGINASLAGPDGFFQPPGVEKIYRSVVLRFDVVGAYP
jgi:hypothetical protein